MTKTHKVIALYLVVGLLFGLQQWIWGAMAYRGLAFNLGRALVWPAVMFPAFGQAVAGIIIVVVIAAILVLN
ncbi:hypothetical protein os1_08620 [Comamonadaceae bacterium OS-1]|nr:hypothetical protein os1_08620 [Comamonadaceae bacterium OS-1]